jgi:ATP-binding cassette subfamily F protein 3
VTHDRYLIDVLATQIWEVNPEESALTVFKGTYSQMKAEREKEAALLAEGVQSLQTLGKSRRREKSDSAKAERRRLAQTQEIENQIAELEYRLAELGAQLENPPEDPAEVAKLGKQYTSVQREMDEKLGEWEGLQK